MPSPNILFIMSDQMIPFLTGAYVFGARSRHPGGEQRGIVDDDYARHAGSINPSAPSRRR